MITPKNKTQGLIYLRDVYLYCGSIPNCRKALRFSHYYYLVKKGFFDGLSVVAFGVAILILVRSRGATQE